jgi:hypothetical protein
VSKGDRNFQVLPIDGRAAKQLRETMESLREDVDATKWTPEGSRGIKLQGTGVVVTYDGSDMSAEDIR